jgi:prophage DNA circulation protein
LADPLVSHVEYVRQQIDRMRRQFPELEEDAELLSSMVEGETDFDQVLDKLLEAFLDRVTMREAVTARIETMKERSNRFDKSAEAIKSIAFDLMQAADKTMVRRPLATLVVSKGRDKLVLDDDFNAQGYMRVKTEPMRADILAALQLGDQIPGARIEKTEPTLSIRTK